MYNTVNIVNHIALYTGNMLRGQTSSFSDIQTERWELQDIIDTLVILMWYQIINCIP